MTDTSFSSTALSLLDFAENGDILNAKLLVYAYTPSVDKSKFNFPDNGNGATGPPPSRSGLSRAGRVLGGFLAGSKFLLGFSFQGTFIPFWFLKK